MNIDFVRTCACASAVCVSLAVSAQDAEGSAQTDANMPAAAQAQPSAKHFHELVRFVAATGDVRVKLPNSEGFTAAVNGKFYPNGSTFLVSGEATDTAEFEFGKESVLKATGNVEFGTRDVPFGAPNRTVLLRKGSILVSLPRTLPTGLFSVAYPNFTAKDLAGESRHELLPSGDGNEAVVHVITGMLALEGLHYDVARMSAADRVRIRTTGDALFTSMRGEAGDYKVSLDQGVTVYRDPITGAVSNQYRRLDFSLTPQCAIKIFRKRSQVGGRMAVSVMTFDPAGEMRNRFTFAEDSAGINFGEEVVRIQDISFKTNTDDKGKKSAEKKEGDGEQQQSEESSGDSGSGGESGSGGGESNAGGFGDGF